MKAGNVPTDRIAPLALKLMNERWPYGGGLEILSEKVGCDEKQLRVLLKQTYAEVDFDFADRLLCALGRPMEDAGLADVYYECDLRTAEERDTRFVPQPRKCEHCDSTYLPTKDAQKFCGAICRNRAAWLRDRRYVSYEPRECQWCENEYAPKRSDSRFCSIRCMNQHGYYKGGGAERQKARRAAA